MMGASRGQRTLQVLLVGAMAGTWTGCRDSPTGAVPEEAPPRILSAGVTATPGGIFHTLVVELEGDGHVVVDYEEANGSGPALRVESRGGPKAATPKHELFLPRLRGDRAYVWEARSLTPEGQAPAARPPEAGSDGIARAGELTTGPLPPELAELELEATGDAGFDLIFLEVGRPSGPHLPVIVDTEGHVVWHSLHEGRAASGFTLFEDSLFAFNTAEGIKVISPSSQEELASLSRARGAERTGLDPFFIHHDVTATPDGTLIFLVLDPTAAGDTLWMGEAVWEWDPWSDELHRRWRSGDFLDPATDRGPRSRPDDWLHANSLSLGPRGNVLISFFWLHEVLSIAPGWDAVEWRLGGPAGTFRGADLAMEAGQHTPTEVAPGRVLLFDNGLDRAAGRFSRALEIGLDVPTGTATVVWEFRPTPDIYAPFVSSTHRLPGGTTFVSFGLAAGLAGGAATGPLVFFEVTPDGEIRWRMEVVAGAELVYRATPVERIAGERSGPHPPPGGRLARARPPGHPHDR